MDFIQIQVKKNETTFLFTRRQRAVYGYLHTHTATVREHGKLAKRVSHRFFSFHEGVDLLQNSKIICVISKIRTGF